MKNDFCSISEALTEIKKGKMLILIDSPDRENEGDFFIPAALITKDIVNFMITYGRGLICVPIKSTQAQRLHLPLMVTAVDNTEKTQVNFTVSVSAKNGITTGISAFDRAKTIQVLTSERSKPDDLVRPGHVFPLVAADNGLRERKGHTEAAIFLSELANLTPAGVLCEIIREDGRMAKLADLIALGKKFDLKIVSISNLSKYSKETPKKTSALLPTLIKVASSSLPTKYGIFRLSIYKSLIDFREHALLLMGNPKKQPIMTRVHSECLTGDTLASLKCDCRQQLHQSMHLISKRKHGIIIYLNQEGRGIGLSNKIKAYALQDKGLDTVEANHALGLPADARDYQVAAEILRDLGVGDIVLLTNSPQKISALSKMDINVVKRLPLPISANQFNRAYLATKKKKFNHKITLT